MTTTHIAPPYHNRQ